MDSWVEGKERRREKEKEGGTDEPTGMGNGKPNGERCEGALSIVETSSLWARWGQCSVMVNFNNKLLGMGVG